MSYYLFRMVVNPYLGIHMVPPYHTTYGRYGHVDLLISYFVTVSKSRFTNRPNMVGASLKTVLFAVSAARATGPDISQFYIFYMVIYFYI